MSYRIVSEHEQAAIMKAEVLGARVAQLLVDKESCVRHYEALKIDYDKLKQQEPVAWCFFRPGISKVDVWKHGGDWQPLYLAAGAQPKEKP
jgi:hypothetical protein